MMVTELGIVTDVKLVHSLNALPPMVVTEFGISTDIQLQVIPFDTIKTRAHTLLSCEYSQDRITERAALVLSPECGGTGFCRLDR